MMASQGGLMSMGVGIHAYGGYIHEIIILQTLGGKQKGCHMKLGAT
jgi:hypothetical protein